MRKCLALLLIALLFTLFAFINESSAESQARVSSFSQDNLKRVVNGSIQDLYPMVDTKIIVVRFSGDDPSFVSRFGLKKIGKADGASDLTVFEFLKQPASQKEAIIRLNEILKFSDFASLVFVFPEGRYALSGVVKIQWKKFLPAEEIKKSITGLDLDLVEFQEDLNITNVRVTEKSGKNPLLWAIIFDPLNDPRVFSVSPEFVRILSPIRSKVEVEAGCLKNAGAGAPVGSIFCYRVKFYRAPNIEISFDDLSINTKLLSLWTPENLPLELRIFKGERVFKKSAEKLESGEILDIVEYKIQFLRSGNYVLPGLRYYYNIIGNLEENKKRLEGITDDVNILVSPLAPLNQETVNDIPKIPFSNRNAGASLAGKSRLMFWVSILLIVSGVFMLILGILKIKKEKKSGDPVSNVKLAHKLWESKKTYVSSMNAVSRLNLLKELLGIYYFNEQFSLAGLNSADWKEKIESKIGEALAEKTARFVYEVEEKGASDIDFNALVEEIFNWEERKNE